MGGARARSPAVLAVPRAAALDCARQTRRCHGVLGPPGSGPCLAVEPHGHRFSGSVPHAGTEVARGVGTLVPCAVGGLWGAEEGLGWLLPPCQGVLRCSPPSPAWLCLAWPRYLRVPWGACGCPREIPWPCPPSSWLLHGACGSGTAPVQAGEIKDCAQRWAGSFFPRWHGVLGWLLQWDVGGPQHCESACGNPHWKGPAQSWGGTAANWTHGASP